MTGIPTMLSWTVVLALAWIAICQAYWFVRGLTLNASNLRARAEHLRLDFEEACADPLHRDVLGPGLAFSRHLDRELRRPIINRAHARHRAKRTVRRLRCWSGPPYYALNALAHDIIAWSRFGPGQTQQRFDKFE